MDSYQAYKDIKTRSLFNIIPEHYHQEILNGSKLIQLKVGESSALKSPTEALYIIYEGEIALYEKDRKLKIVAKAVSKGRSLELDRFINQQEDGLYNWEITKDIVAFEIPKPIIFEIFDRDKIFHKYLERLLSSNELRKLKNDLRLFGFNEDEIQKTFFCLREYSDTIGKIEDAICIIRESQVTFFYFFDGNRKVLGEFGVGDFFVWNKNRKVNYEVSDNFKCWRLEVTKWSKFVDKNKIRSFVQLVDPFKGKINSSNKTRESINQRDVLVNQNETFESFCDEEFVDFEEVYLTSEDSSLFSFISTYSLVKSFKINIDKQYLSKMLPIAEDGSSLYDINKILRQLGFRTLLINLSPRQIKEVKWPIIMSLGNKHCVIYEKVLGGYIVMDPAIGRVEVAEEQMELNSSFLCLLVKSSDIENKNSYKTNITLDYLKIVFQSIKPLTFIFLASLLIFVLNLVIPVVTQIIFDVVLVNKDLALLNTISLLAILLLLTSSLLIYVRTYLLTHLTSIVDAKFSSLFFSILLRLHRKFYDKYSAGDIISRLSELKKIRKFFTAKTFKLFVDSLSAILFVIVLGHYNIKLLICVLMLLPLILIYLRFLTPKIVHTLNNLYEYGAQAQSQLIEQFGAIGSVKASAMTYSARQRWENKFFKLLEQRKKFELLNAYIGVGSDFFLQFIPLIVVILAIYLHIENELTLGQVIASTSIVGFIIFPVINLMKFLDDFKQVGVSFKRINEVVSSATETFGENKVPVDIDFKKISVDKLSFKYGNELSSYAIKNITLDIDVGKNYAFVGSSGAGKTTLAQMLIGYDWPVSGNIKVDGLNINMINLEELRRLVAYVGAEPITFSGTIVENISLDSTDSSIEKVIEAAKIADAHEFISSLPFGYMTLLGESGQGLSLGQKQKICIARALYARPKVLILDEATSILDSTSERSIFQNLKDTMIGRSLIIVTHRLHLLNQVEQIVVIHNGEVVEKGAHDDLIMLQGRYYEMWKDINY